MKRLSENIICRLAVVLSVSGEKLSDLRLEVLGIRLQLDIYKTTGYYVDQSVLAADADGNRYTFIIKAAASSMSPDMLSCYTKKSMSMKVCI